MIDYPPGQWTPALIGLFWPGGASTEAAAASSRNRGTIEQLFQDYQSQLANVRQGPLAEEQGEAADAARAAFHQGEMHAGDVSEKNGVKKDSYQSVATTLESLRSSLRQVAEDGNKVIDGIIKTKADPATKLAKISEYCLDAQGYSSHLSTQHVNQIKDAVQKILTAQGDSRTPDQLAKELGLDLSSPPIPSQQAINEQVKTMLESSPGSSDSIGSGASSSLMSSSNDSAISNLTSGTSEAPLPGAAGPSIGGALGAANDSGAPVKTVSNATGGGQQGPSLFSSNTATSSPDALGGPGLPPSSPPAGLMGGVGSGGGLASGGSGVGGVGTSTGASASSGSAFGGGDQSGASTSTGAGLGSHGGPPAGLTPEGLAQSFNQGAQSGGAMSGPAEALSQGIANGAQSPVTHADLPSPASASTAPSSGGHYNFESANSYSQPAAPTYTPPADTSSQMYAAPAATPAAPMAPTGGGISSAPAGPLPTYGSDLRPAASAAAPAPMPASPAAASPLSAPVNPASGQSPIGQPTVVKQQPVASAAPLSSAGLVENAAAATATGAVAGVASQKTVAQKRLQTLVDFVARQEPKLSWIVGDREDGTTVLATDLASGWIPPHIEIPSGVQLLEPARRRGSLEHLLGETTETATWTPGHYLPPEKDVDPLPTSLRSRQVPEIAELNWELAQSTNWRDGLPRLAHTLTKVGAAGTGVLDSELDMLLGHLAASGHNVLAAYPDNVNADDVGNWQLLAAIEALLTKQKTALNYHFAWFQALSMATQGGAR